MFIFGVFVVDVTRVIAALLHDPLDKCVSFERVAHTARALEHVYDLLNGVVSKDSLELILREVALHHKDIDIGKLLNKLSGDVKKLVSESLRSYRGRRVVCDADTVASSVQRYGADVDDICVRDVFYVHPLCGVWYRVNKDVVSSEAKGVYNLLKDLLRDAKRLCGGLSLDDVLNLLWAFLEDFSSRYPNVYLQPEDTRVPFYTLLDHLYATAQVASLTPAGRRFRGYVIVVKIRGVQEFISASRTLADLWASSMLVSLFSWRIIQYFIDKYGPQSVLRPSLRMNPYYLAYVAKKICEKCSDVKQAKNEEEAKGILARKCVEFLKRSRVYYNEKEGVENIRKALSTPLIPETLIFIVGERRGEKEVKPEDIARDIELEVSKLWQKIVSKVIDIVGESLDIERATAGEALKKILDYPPPLTVTVAYTKLELETSEDLEKAIKVCMKAVKQSSPAPRTMYVFDEQRACSVCGRYTAVVEKRPGSKSTVLKERERLCPYCLVKRLFRNVYSDIAVELFGIAPEVKVFESLSELAGKVLIEELVEAVSKAYKNGGDVESRLKELAKAINEAYRNSEVFAKELKREEIPKDLEDKISRLPKRLAEPLREIASAPPSLLVGDVEPRSSEDKDEAQRLRAKARTVLENVEKCVRRLIGEVAKATKDESYVQFFDRYLKYVAIVKADGDYMGDIIGCKWGELEDKAPIRLPPTLKEILESIGALKEVAKRFENLKINWPKVVPAHLTATSRALIVLGLKISEIIERHKGFVVYCGGDDVLAVLPVKEVVPCIEDMMKEFSKPLIGFRDAAVTGFGPFATQSYAVSIMHFAYPLYAMLSKLFEASEEKDLYVLAKQSKGLGKNNIKASLTVMAYSSSGPLGTCKVPLRTPKYFELAKDCKGKPAKECPGQLQQRVREKWAPGLSGESLTTALYNFALTTVYGRGANIGAGVHAKLTYSIFRDYLEEVESISAEEEDSRCCKHSLESKLLKTCQLFENRLRGVFEEILTRVLYRNLDEGVRKQYKDEDVFHAIRAWSKKLIDCVIDEGVSVYSVGDDSNPLRLFLAGIGRFLDILLR